MAAPATNGIALEARNLRKVYHRGSEDIVAVDDISLTVGKGEFVSFIGPSGSGKTTLINILGCLDNPTSGTLTIGQREVFADCKGRSVVSMSKDIPVDKYAFADVPAKS